MGMLDIQRGGTGMNRLLERLGGFAARRHWIVIIAWLVILGGTLWARHASGGEFVNNYSVSGSGSALGQDKPRHLVISPGIVDGGVNTVVELGFLRPVDADVLTLLEQASASIAITLQPDAFAS